ncbi:MAG TPA: hypothetical protein VIF40_09330 [Methylosinus sp.]|jgi:hypothetical protein|uniref:hypothetical protein n=1 Tax=Methylosinus sp. TaxID=427 RepID=UPI002F92F747
MGGPARNAAALRLAAKYVWGTPPEIVVSSGLRGLVVNVMELGAWEDAHELLELVGPDLFVDVLESPPPGVISNRSLAFWHRRLGREGAPPKSRKRFA